MKIIKGEILENHCGKMIVTEEPSGSRFYELKSIHGETISNYTKYYSIEEIIKSGFKKTDEIFKTFSISSGDAFNKFVNIIKGTVSNESRGRLNPNDIFIDSWKINLDVHYYELIGIEKGNGYIAGFPIR